MTTRSTMKSYSKVLQISYETSASVDFKDSGNNAIECNYFSVDCRSNGTVDAGYFIAQPSGVYGTEIAGLTGMNSASAISHHATAGIGGVIGTADGSVEMSLPSKTSGVMIFNKLVGTSAQSATVPAIFVVTYGNRKWANPKRDQDDTYYPPGN